MDIAGLLNKFIGSGSNNNSKFGVAGGALAGTAMALLIGNKGVKKLAGTAASVGGMALLGGLAVKAFQTWQQQSKQPVIQGSSDSIPQSFLVNTNGKDQLEMIMIKAMVAAAKSDGHLDGAEQEKIFKQAKDYDLTNEEKALMFDLISKPIGLQEICSSVSSIEHKAEVYLASKIVCGGDHPDERKYLAQLAEGLHLPQELVQQLDQQVAALI
jgi:uncharacterized membrane protein YebE (DUF533 family)